MEKMTKDGLVIGFTKFDLEEETETIEVKEKTQKPKKFKETKVEETKVEETEKAEETTNF